MVALLKNEKLYHTLIAFFLIDLVLGGAGTYLSVGPISIRKVLFALIAALMLYQILVLKKIEVLKTNKNTYLLALLLVVFGIISLIGVFNNPLDQVVNKALGYAYVFILPFFLINITTKAQAVKWFHFFRRLVLILAGTSLVIFALIFINPSMFLGLVHRLITDLNLGAIAMSNNLPRIFFKTSIFVPFALNYELIVLVYEQRLPTLKELVGIAVLALSIVSSFTMGIWASTVVVVLVAMLIARKKLLPLLKPKKNQWILAGVLMVGVLSAFQFGLVDIIMARFSSGDSSLIVKMEQAKELLGLFLQRPLFGHGFGKVITIVADGQTITRINWEIMWLELLVNGGLVGLCSYLTFIGYNFFFGLKRVECVPNNAAMLTCIVSSFVGLVLVNFSNPFLNNPIGIGYLIFMIAIMHCVSNTDKLESNAT